MHQTGTTTLYQLGAQLDPSPEKREVLTALGYGPDWLIASRWREPPRTVSR